MSVGRPRFVGSCVLVWLVVAAGVCGVESVRAGRESEGAREFQSLVGGLGLGSERDLGRCGAAFDPRLGRSCPDCIRQSLLGRAVCPAHTLPPAAPR